MLRRGSGGKERYRKGRNRTWWKRENGEGMLTSGSGGKERRRRKQGER